MRDDDIEPAVPVQIPERQRVGAAADVVVRFRAECAISVPQQYGDRMVADVQHHEIWLRILVDVTDSHTRRIPPSQVVDVTRERPIPVSQKYRDTALVRGVRREARRNDVLGTIAIEIRDRGIREAGATRELPRLGEESGSSSA